MSKIELTILSCGMNDSYISEHIKIFKPTDHLIITYTTEELQSQNISQMSQFVNFIKADTGIRQNIEDYVIDNINLFSIYIKYNDYLIGLAEDKSFAEIIDYLNLKDLSMLFVFGIGASESDEFHYKYVIHSNEKIHENLPHVHVVKDGISIRYSLDTLQPIDPLKNPHKRDNKKRIIPHIEANKKRFLEMWDLNIHGYTTPEITEKHVQYYSES